MYYISLLRNSLLVEQQNQKCENLFLRPLSEKEHQISSFNLRWLMSYDAIHESQGWSGASEFGCTETSSALHQEGGL